jgi:hypothetical protein
MAVITLPRSPRRAQLHLNSGLPRKPRRLMKPVERLPVYENLFALNRDLEQVLIDIAQLQELGVFQRDLSQAFDGEAPDSSGQATAPQRWFEGRMSGNLNFLRIGGGLAPVQNPVGYLPVTGQDPCVVQWGDSRRTAQTDSLKRRVEG